MIARLVLALGLAAGAAGCALAEGAPRRGADPGVHTERSAGKRGIGGLVYYGRMGAPFLPRQGTVVVVQGSVVQPVRVRRSEARCPLIKRHAAAPEPAPGSGA